MWSGVVCAERNSNIKVCCGSSHSAWFSGRLNVAFLTYTLLETVAVQDNDDDEVPSWIFGCCCMHVKC